MALRPVDVADLDSEFVKSIRMEDEEGCADEEDPGGGVIPAQMLAEVEGDEDAEDDRVMIS